MKKENISKTLFFLLAVLGMLPILAGAFLESAFILGFILTFYTAKHGIGFTVRASILLALFGFIAFGIYGSVYAVCMCLPFYAIGQLMHKRHSLSKLLIVGTILQSLLWGVSTRLKADEMHIESFELLFGSIFQTIKENVQMILSSDAALSKELLMSFSYMEQLIETMLPCIYILASLFIIYITFVTCRMLLGRQGICYDNMPQFHQFWLPKSMGTIFLILFFISMFMGNAPILMNIVSIVFTLYVICGLSTASSFLKQKGVPNTLRIMIVTVLLLVSSAIGGIATTILCCMGMYKTKHEIRE